MSEPRRGEQNVPGSEYVPIVTASENVAETTLRALILGTLIAIVFGAANAYLGLRFGMTVSASLPAAVISMLVLKAILRRGTVLENNIVQSIGSSGESLAAGVIFTIPAFFIWESRYSGQFDFGVSPLVVILLALLGGTLGILLMIPLRRYLMEREHGKLKFPEGTACAEIIAAGDEGGTKAKMVFWGMGIGALHKFFYNGLRLWPESPGYNFSDKLLNGATIGMDTTPALLGVGVIIGPRIAALMLAGSVLGYVALAPLIKYIGSAVPAGINVLPADMPISEMGPSQLRNYFIKYIGVGAVTVAGFVSLIKAMPVIGHSFAEGIKQIFRPREAALETKRTERDLPMTVVLVGTLLVALLIWILPGLNLPFIAVLMSLLFGFFFVVVAARIVGIVGSSSSPVSGMTIATLLATCVILLAFGFGGFGGMMAAMSVGAVVCIAVCMSGDISQDLKTGWLLGSTPSRVQLVEFVGLAAAALTMGFVIFLLRDTFGFVVSPEHPRPLEAPQANIMATIVEGIFKGELPWLLIVSGGFIALTVEMLGIGSLPFAIGLYLPISLMTPIMAGGALTWLVGKFAPAAEAKYREEKGVLFASGMVAGDALVGVMAAFAVWMSNSYADYYNTHADGMVSGVAGNWVALAMFAAIMVVFWLFVQRRERT